MESGHGLLPRFIQDRFRIFQKTATDLRQEDAGGDQILTYANNVATLDATVLDDGYTPSVTTTWTSVRRGSIRTTRHPFALARFR